jgi:hypothetical protein
MVFVIISHLTRMKTPTKVNECREASMEDSYRGNITAKKARRS